MIEGDKKELDWQTRLRVIQFKSWDDFAMKAIRGIPSKKLTLLLLDGLHRKFWTMDEIRREFPVGSLSKLTKKELNAYRPQREATLPLWLSAVKQTPESDRAGLTLLQMSQRDLILSGVLTPEMIAKEESQKLSRKGKKVKDKIKIKINSK